MARFFPAAHYAPVMVTLTGLNLWKNLSFRSSLDGMEGRKSDHTNNEIKEGDNSALLLVIAQLLMWPLFTKLCMLLSLSLCCVYVFVSFVEGSSLLYYGQLLLWLGIRDRLFGQQVASQAGSDLVSCGWPDMLCRNSIVWMLLWVFRLRGMWWGWYKSSCRSRHLAIQLSWQEDNPKSKSNVFFFCREWKEKWYLQL